MPSDDAPLAIRDGDFEHGPSTPTGDCLASATASSCSAASGSAWRAGLEVDGVIGLVGQMRPAILQITSWGHLGQGQPPFPVSRLEAEKSREVLLGGYG